MVTFDIVGQEVGPRLRPGRDEILDSRGLLRPLLPTTVRTSRPLATSPALVAAITTGTPAVVPTVETRPLAKAGTLLGEVVLTLVETTLRLVPVTRTVAFLH